MTDIMHALTQLPFIAGFITGGVVFGFLGLAIGWSKGHNAGWFGAVEDCGRYVESKMRERGDYNPINLEDRIRREP
jgi:outer membrane lipoprotein SlyB